MCDQCSLAWYILGILFVIRHSAGGYLVGERLAIVRERGAFKFANFVRDLLDLQIVVGCLPWYGLLSTRVRSNFRLL